MGFYKACIQRVLGTFLLPVLAAITQDLEQTYRPIRALHVLPEDVVPSYRFIFYLYN